MDKHRKKIEMNKKLIPIIASVAVIIIAAFAGWYFATKSMSQKIDANGIVVKINKNADYQAKMLTTYEEYKILLEENEINLDNSNLLKAKDFDESDYIIDYIPYDKDLIVEDINVDILEGGVAIHYITNHEVKENTELLLYFIPVPKKQILEFTLANRTFDYKNK